MCIHFSQTTGKIFSEGKTKRGREQFWKQKLIFGFKNGTLFQVANDVSVEILFYPQKDH